ncbi:hypothetical protein MHU86_13938 [Fragilaria crotonensis]|nr:hypothetical protein MHU86_13938 [Fragilaria crotonensis]
MPPSIPVMLRRSMTINTLVPPRTVWDIATSAVAGAVSLVTDQEHRDAYVSMKEKGIIRDDVFWHGGSNGMFSMALVLALYQELDNPILKKYGFKADEFLEGVKPALEHFHDVESRLENKLFQLMKPKPAPAPDDNDTTETEEDDATVLQGSKAVDAESETYGLTENERNAMKEIVRLEASISQMLTNATVDNASRTDASSTLNNVINWDWNDSLAQDFRLMVSPDFYKANQKGKSFGVMLSKLKGMEVTYVEDSTNVANVALLSARVMVEDREETKEIDYENVSDDELNVRDAEDGHRATVAAQIEVLYDIEQQKKVRTWSDDLSEGEMKESDYGELTERSLRVGVLEGYLKGSGEDKVLRWRLANVREPWEMSPVETEFEYQQK